MLINNPNEKEGVEGISENYAGNYAIGNKEFSGLPESGTNTNLVSDLFNQRL